MSVYAVGDIHGCYDEFRRLLSLIKFNSRSDTLWLVGDVVNRGHDSLSVLRWLYQHDHCVMMVLGNHDLHLLAVHNDACRLRPKDNFSDVLTAADAGQLCEWLRRRPLAHYDKGFLLVHAGLLPAWDVEAVLYYAREAAAIIGGDEWDEFAGQMYGDTPTQWNDVLVGAKRWRVIINALTRLRICTLQGGMCMRFGGQPTDTPVGYLPWFDIPGRRTASVKVICGHWAALGLVRRSNLLALDSGCVWGGVLSAVRLDDSTLFQVVR